MSSFAQDPNLAADYYAIADQSLDIFSIDDSLIASGNATSTLESEKHTDWQPNLEPVTTDDFDFERFCLEDRVQSTGSTSLEQEQNISPPENNLLRSSGFNLSIDPWADPSAHQKPSGDVCIMTYLSLLQTNDAEHAKEKHRVEQMKLDLKKDKSALEVESRELQLQKAKVEIEKELQQRNYQPLR